MTRAIRFQPDPLDYALIDFEVAEKFTPTALGIIINESYTGCALVVKTSEIFEKKQIRIQVGRMDPLKAEIVWIKKLDEEIMKIGIHFVE